MEPGPHGVPVDERMRVTGAGGVWAVGDVTGIKQLTHVGKYQGRASPSDQGEEARALERPGPAGDCLTAAQAATAGS